MNGKRAVNIVDTVCPGMTAKEVQSAVDALAVKMVAKGLIMPECAVTIRANAESYCYIRWNKRDVGGRYESDNSISEFFRAGTLADKIAAATARVDGMPNKHDRDTAEFMARLAETIEHGKKIGVDAAFVNPLVDAMKRLSENVITYRAAA